MDRAAGQQLGAERGGEGEERGRRGAERGEARRGEERREEERSGKGEVRGQGW